MKKLLKVCSGWVFVFHNMLIISAALAVDEASHKKTIPPTFRRTSSQEELDRLHQKKADLLKRQETLKQEVLKRKERHFEIEKLKKEIQELEETNLGLQKELGAPLTGIGRILNFTSDALNDPNGVPRPGKRMNTPEDPVMLGKRMNTTGANATLAKRTNTTGDHVPEDLKLMALTKSLLPSQQAVKCYIQSRLWQPFKTDTLQEEIVCLENIQFSSRFYVAKYNSASNYNEKGLTVFSISPKVFDQFPPLLHGNYKEKLSHFLEGRALQPSYVDKNANTLFCNFGFLMYSYDGSYGTMPIYVGMLLLRKPIDIHLYLE